MPQMASPAWCISMQGVGGEGMGVKWWGGHGCEVVGRGMGVKWWGGAWV